MPNYQGLIQLLVLKSINPALKGGVIELILLNYHGIYIGG